MLATALGSTDLSQGVPHGLQYEFDDDDATTAKEEYLYHANNQQTIFKTDHLAISYGKVTLVIGLIQNQIFGHLNRQIVL